MSFNIALNSQLLWFMFIFGTLIGSFLNVVILRIPEGTFWKNTRSVCPNCQKVIPWWLNIPVFGWIVLRGRAKCCGVKISIQYPIVELLTGLLFAFSYWKHPFWGIGMNLYLDPTMFNLQESIRFLHATVFVCLMLVCSVIDMRLMIIPDKISLPMIGLTPVIAWIHPELDLKSALLGALLGGGFLYGIAWFYWFVRREYGLGFGDVKLLAAIGGWLGYQSVFPTLFLGSIIGSIIGVTVLAVARRLSWKAQLPFGPFLAGGAILHLWWGAEIFTFVAGF